MEIAFAVVGSNEVPHLARCVRRDRDYRPPVRFDRNRYPRAARTKSFEKIDGVFAGLRGGVRVVTRAVRPRGRGQASATGASRTGASASQCRVLPPLTRTKDAPGSWQQTLFHRGFGPAHYLRRRVRRESLRRSSPARRFPCRRAHSRRSVGEILAQHSARRRMSGIPADISRRRE